MFGNRGFLVKMVKDEESEVAPTEPVDYNAIAKTMGSNVVGVIFMYMGMDTVRQVLIHIARTKI